MKLYLARHGRTNYNDQGLCNADPAVDVHLTTEGKHQAETLAVQLKDVSFDHIYASQLRRTQQTADAVNAFHHAQVTVDARLNDIRTGFEGKHFREYMDALDASEDRWRARCNDGESVEDMKVRVVAFLEELKSEPYDTVLVVTSEWVAYAIIALIRGLSNQAAWDLDMQQGTCIELELR